MGQVKILLRGNDVRNWTNSSSQLDLYLAALGFEIVDSFKEKPDAVVFLNWGRDSRKDIIQSSKVGAKTLLVMTEPSVVIPQHRSPKVLRKFSSVLKIGRPWTDAPIPYPQVWNTKHFHANRRQEAVVAITGNKVSFIRGELYSLRLLAYQELHNIEIFGAGWDMSSISKASQVARHLAGALLSGERLTFEGFRQLNRSYWPSAAEVQNKFATMSKFKYALVIENSAEYVSEKLADAIMAGTLPIYVGADPTPFGVPRELFVRCSPSPQAIIDAVQAASLVDYDKWRENAWSWLQQPHNQASRSSKAINQTIAREIGILTGAELN